MPAVKPSEKRIKTAADHFFFCSGIKTSSFPYTNHTHQFPFPTEQSKLRLKTNHVVNFRV